MRRARTYRWTRMPPYRARFRGQGVFFAFQSWAGCITNIFGFDLRQAHAPRRTSARAQSPPGARWAKRDIGPKRSKLTLIFDQHGRNRIWRSGRAIMRPVAGKYKKPVTEGAIYGRKSDLSQKLSRSRLQHHAAQ